MRFQVGEPELQPIASPLTFLHAELRTVFDALPVGVILAESPSGATIFENARAREILGDEAGRPASVDERLRRWARPADGSCWDRAELPAARALAGAVIERACMIVTDRHDTIRHVSVNAAPTLSPDGTITGAIVTLEEVRSDSHPQCEQAHLSRAAEDIEQRYQSLFEEAADAILVFDQDGHLVDVNATAIRMLQYTREDLLGIRIGDGKLLASDPAWAVREHAFLRREGLWQGELQLRRKDGSSLPVESRIVRIELADGPVYRATCRDITERRALEQLREEVQAVVLHELLNPVSALKGHAQILERLGRYDQRAVAAIVRQSDHLHRLSEDLLESARLQSGQFTLRRQRLDPAQVAHQAVERAQAAGPTHVIRFEVRGQPARGSWDHDRLDQIFNNLLSNAVKHTPPGTQIAVTVEEVGRHLHVSIQDDGPGIPPRDLPRLFQRFFRGKATRAQGIDGTGLGLATTKALVEAHDGSIRVETAPGRGAMFSFTLPYEASEEAHQDLTPRQVDIARLIARGLTNRQIAEELVLAQGTVANHIDHILRRLGLTSRVQVATWAASRGIN